MGAAASDLDTIGVTVLRHVDATLSGAGIPVAQPEAAAAAGSPAPFEVNPSTVGQPATLFTYISSNGTATVFPNSVGAESGHADSVGGNLYGTTVGVAPQVSHVYNYEANYFFENIISVLSPPSIPARLVNQSFIFNGLTTAQDASVDQDYDNYAANNNTLFASGAGNGGPVSPAATCYNGLGVGVYGAGSSYGPSYDGRCKPDITAPGGATSFSTPYVAGGAAVLLQAANRGDGGANTSAAGDLRTLKALLLNGAVKTADWTNGPGIPLDARYGAGILNVFNSWHQLAGGQHAFVESTSNASGAPHPPGTSAANEPVLVGWDFNSITNARAGLNYNERVNHYYFNLNAYTGNTFTVTATLMWNRQRGQSAINDLNLFLYDMSTTNLVGVSTSAVDNVEHIVIPSLPKGRYDLQVLKNPTGQVSAAETYALAFEIFNLQLNITRTSNTINLTWPLAPAGFTLLSTTNLLAPAWVPVSAPVSLVGNQNVVSLPASGTQQYFRLSRPEGNSFSSVAF